MLMKWFKKKDNNSKLLKSIFPAYFLDELNIIENIIDFKSKIKLYKPFIVFYEGIQMSIPYRIYLDTNLLPPMQK